VRRRITLMGTRQRKVNKASSKLTASGPGTQNQGRQGRSAGNPPGSADGLVLPKAGKERQNRRLRAGVGGEGLL